MVLTVDERRTESWPHLFATWSCDPVTSPRRLTPRIRRNERARRPQPVVRAVTRRLSLIRPRGRVTTRLGVHSLPMLVPPSRMLPQQTATNTTIHNVVRNPKLPKATYCHSTQLLIAIPAGNVARPRTIRPDCRCSSRTTPHRRHVSLSTCSSTVSGRC